MKFASKSIQMTPSKPSCSEDKLFTAVVGSEKTFVGKSKTISEENYAGGKTKQQPGSE